MARLESKVEQRIANFEVAVKKRIDDIEAKVRTDWKPVIIALVIAILTVAAAESAIGLAILVIYFHNRRNIEVENISSMQG